MLAIQIFHAGDAFITTDDFMNLMFYHLHPIFRKMISKKDKWMVPLPWCYLIVMSVGWWEKKMVLIQSVRDDLQYKANYIDEVFIQRLRYSKFKIRCEIRRFVMIDFSGQRIRFRFVCFFFCWFWKLIWMLLFVSLLNSFCMFNERLCLNLNLISGDECAVCCF